MSAQKLEQLQQLVTAAGLDAIVLVPGSNLAYVSGIHFFPSERPQMAFFLPQGQPVFIVPELDRVKLQDANPFPHRVFSYSDTSGPDGAFAAAAEALQLAGKRVGIEGLLLRFFEQALLTRHTGAALVDATGILEPLRIAKTSQEIEWMQQAIDLSEAALKAVLVEVAPGMSERAIANRLTAAMLERGAGGMAFGPLVLTGPNSALPHGSTGERALREGDILLVDYGATINGYAADITRTYVVGELRDAALRDAYAAVLAANEAGRSAAGPGVPCQEVDRAARAAIERAGFGEFFIHRTGHGLGMETHEAPYIREGNAQPLAPGHVITVEPGVYLPGVGGIRIEDDVLITGDGARSLTTLPRELQPVG